MNTTKRIAELEQAILDANDNLEGGEGIDLLYHWFDDGRTELSRKLIKEIIQRKVNL